MRMPTLATHHAPPATAPRPDRLIRLPEAERLASIKKSLIYELMRKPLEDGGFPRPVRLSSRTVAWSENAVLAWVHARVSEAQQGDAARTKADKRDA